MNDFVFLSFAGRYNNLKRGSLTDNSCLMSPTSATPYSPMSPKFFPPAKSLHRNYSASSAVKNIPPVSRKRSEPSAPMHSPLSPLVMSPSLPVGVSKDRTMTPSDDSRVSSPQQEKNGSKSSSKVESSPEPTRQGLLLINDTVDVN